MRRNDDPGRMTCMPVGAVRERPLPEERALHEAPLRVRFETQEMRGGGFSPARASALKPDTRGGGSDLIDAVKPGRAEPASILVKKFLESFPCHALICFQYNCGTYRRPYPEACMVILVPPRPDEYTARHVLSASVPPAAPCHHKESLRERSEMKPVFTRMGVSS